MNELLMTMRERYESLGERDRRLLNAMIAVIIFTLFYLMVWEPVTKGHERAAEERETLMEINTWMHSAAAEAKALRASGTGTRAIADQNSPVSLILEKSVKTSGLNDYVKKIESSGKDTAQIKLESVQFNQLLIWLRTLSTRYALTVDSAEMNRVKESGMVDARLTIRRNTA